MHSAVQMQDRVRPFACALIDYQHRRTGSRMAAYDRVADETGVSSSWLRRLVGRAHLDLAAHEYLNILAAYASLCERIERQTEHERQITLALKGDADAAIEGALGVGLRGFRTEESGA